MIGDVRWILDSIREVEDIVGSIGQGVVEDHAGGDRLVGDGVGGLPSKLDADRILAPLLAEQRALVLQDLSVVRDISLQDILIARGSECLNFKVGQIEGPAGALAGEPGVCEFIDRLGAQLWSW